MSCVLLDLQLDILHHLFIQYACPLCLPLPGVKWGCLYCLEAWYSFSAPAHWFCEFVICGCMNTYMWFDISSWWLRNIWDQTDLCGGSNVPFQSHWTGPECLFSFWLLMERTMQQFIVNKYTCRFKRNARLKSLLLDFHGRLHLWYCSAVFLYDRDVFGRRCSLAQDRSQSPLLLESPCRIGMWMSLVAMQLLFFELQLEFLVCACRMIGLLWMTDRLDELMHELFLHEMYLQ